MNIQKLQSEMLPLAHQLGKLKFPNTRAESPNRRYVSAYGAYKWKVCLAFQGRQVPIAITDCLRGAQRLADLATLFFHRWQKKDGDPNPTRLNYALSDAESDKDTLNEHILCLVKMWNLLKEEALVESDEIGNDVRDQKAAFEAKRNLLLLERAAKLEEVNLWYRNSVNELENI